MDPIKNRDIPASYVSLPEGSHHDRLGWRRTIWTISGDEGRPEKAHEFLNRSKWKRRICISEKKQCDPSSLGAIFFTAMVTPIQLIAINRPCNACLDLFFSKTTIHHYTRKVTSGVHFVVKSMLGSMQSGRLLPQLQRFDGTHEAGKVDDVSSAGWRHWMLRDVEMFSENSHLYNFLLLISSYLERCEFSLVSYVLKQQELDIEGQPTSTNRPTESTNGKPQWKLRNDFNFSTFRSKVVSTHLWNTPLNLYQQAIKGFLS